MNNNKNREISAVFSAASTATEYAAYGLIVAVNVYALEWMADFVLTGKTSAEHLYISLAGGGAAFVSFTLSIAIDQASDWFKDRERLHQNHPPDDSRTQLDAPTQSQPTSCL